MVRLSECPVTRTPHAPTLPLVPDSKANVLQCFVPARALCIHVCLRVSDRCVSACLCVCVCVCVGPLRSSNRPAGRAFRCLSAAHPPIALHPALSPFATLPFNPPSVSGQMNEGKCQPPEEREGQRGGEMEGETGGE